MYKFEFQINHITQVINFHMEIYCLITRRDKLMHLLLVPISTKFYKQQNLYSNEEIQNNLDQFFASKEQTFYEHVIILLPEGCKRCWTKMDNM